MNPSFVSIPKSRAKKIDMLHKFELFKHDKHYRTFEQTASALGQNPFGILSEGFIGLRIDMPSGKVATFRLIGSDKDNGETVGWWFKITAGGVTECRELANYRVLIVNE